MQDFIKTSLDYIEQNLKTEIKTDELANMTGYSVTHYRRMFIQTTGLSVAKYIAKKRINHALLEILAGRKAIDAVLEYGFDNYSVFYRAFIKMYGCSPMKYLTIYKNLTPKELEDILMEYNLTEQQKNTIIENDGKKFYEKVLENFDLYSEKWKLPDFEFYDDIGFHHVTFHCKSELYGDCILKIYDDDELVVAYNALREYNGGCYVKAFDYEPNDHIHGAMLTERVFPGEPLGDEAPLEKRLAVFSELFNGMHIEPKNPDVYYSYTKWVSGIGTRDFYDIVNGTVEKKTMREDCTELYPHELKAKEIYSELSSVYDKKLLLHGQLNSYNIISCGEGKHKFIHPAGVIGDPIFDAGSFITGECCWWRRSIAEPEKVETIIDYLEKSLNIPNKILRQCFYISTVMGDWEIDRIEFAESVLNKGKL